MAILAPWPQIYQARRDRARRASLECGLDGLVVMQPANRFYLSGFELHDGQPGESAGFLVITGDGNDWLATDSRFAEAAARIWPGDRIFVYGAKQPIDCLLARCGTVLGVESDGVSWKWLLERRRYSGPCPKLLPVSGIVEKLRMVKEACEVEALEKSFAINHKLLAWMENSLDQFIGMTERALSWEVEKFFRQNGVQELAFATIAAIGKNGALPHAIPGDAVLELEMPFLLDLGCRVDNYCSDQTRSWWAGAKPSREFENALKLVREAQAAALDIIRPGVVCADVYHAAYRVFEKAGVAAAFTHGLGHGIGLETHEAPSFNPRSRTTLEKNMVITVEPGLYYPEWGGVRWEHTVIVEDNGPKIL